MDLIAPILAMLALWWVSTGAILMLGERSDASRRAAMVLVSALAMAGLAGVWLLRDSTEPLDAYFGALCALALWGWHEMSFLFGYITGPNRSPCPDGAKGWLRFKAATATLMHHEIALALTVVLLGVMSLGAENATAFQVFALLFALRLSSKLNLFIGAPHFTDQFLPKRLSHLHSYFSKEPSGVFFFVTTTLITLGAAALLWGAAVTDLPFEASTLALLGTLAALGALEHLFLALPVPDAALWRWLLPARDPRRTPDL